MTTENLHPIDIAFLDGLEQIAHQLEMLDGQESLRVWWIREAKRLLKKHMENK